MYLLEKLNREARKASGHIYVMNGNHDLRYATPAGSFEFQNWAHWVMLGNSIKEQQYLELIRGWVQTSQDKANPLAMILSAAMLLEYGLGEVKAAERIEKAMLETFDKGFRTRASSPKLQGTGWPTEVRRAKRSYADSAQAGVTDESRGKSSVDDFSRMEKLELFGENENLNGDLFAARLLA